MYVIIIIHFIHPMSNPSVSKLFHTGITCFNLLNSLHCWTCHKVVVFDFYCTLSCLCYLRDDVFGALFFLLPPMKKHTKKEFCTTALFSILTNPVCSHFLSCLFIYLTLVHFKRLLAPTGQRCVLSATPSPQSPSETHIASRSSFSHSLSLPRPFITSVAAEAAWQRAFTRRHSP